MDELGFIKSQLYECYHKRIIVNPFTREKLMVPCGTCPACLLRNSFFKEVKCKAQESISRYCSFITLSYDNRFIPRFRIVQKDVIQKGVYRIHLESIDRNIKKLGDTRFKNTFIINHKDLEYYTQKANLAVRRKYYDKNYEWTFSWLDRKDVSLFIKRVRKGIFNLLGRYEKIHTYIVGEYGPDHFRAHWHLLFFYNSSEIAENLRRIGSESWQFGIFDYSLSRKDVSTYVAGYVNSFVCIPPILKTVSELRPYSRFSNHFGFQYFSRFCEAVDRGQFSNISTQAKFYFNGSYYKLSPSISFIRSRLFIPAGFRDCSLSTYLSISHLGQKLLLDPRFRSVDKKNRFVVSQFVDKLLNYLDKYKFNFKFLTKNDSIFYSFLRVFRINSRNLYTTLTNDIKVIKGRLYRFFLHFKMVCRNRCINISSHRFDECSFINMYNSLKKFYNEQILENFHRGIEVFNNCPKDLRIHYWEGNRYPEKLKESRLYQKIIDYQFLKLKERIKHRKINDLLYSYS